MYNQNDQPPQRPQNPYQNGVGPQPQPRRVSDFSTTPQPTTQQQMPTKPEPNFSKPTDDIVRQENPANTIPLQPIQDPIIEKSDKTPRKVASIIGIIFAFVALSIPGLILCITAKSKAKQTNQKNSLATIGIVLNIISFFVYVGLFFVIFDLPSIFNNDQSKITYNASIVQNYAEKYQESRDVYPDELSDFEEGTIDGKKLDEYVKFTDSLDKSNAKSSIIYEYTGEFGKATGGRIRYYNLSTDSISKEVIYIGEAKENSNFLDIL